MTSSINTFSYGFITRQEMMADPKEPASNEEDSLPQSFLIHLLRECEKLDQLYSPSDGLEKEVPRPRPASSPVSISLYQARYELLVKTWLEHAVYEHTKGTPNDVKCEAAEDVREKMILKEHKALV